MPISVDLELKRLGQCEFAHVSFDVMREIFVLHGELGRLFDESVYQNALSSRLGNLRTEVRTNVAFRDFCKSYYMDVVAERGAVFELKESNSDSRNTLLTHSCLNLSAHHFSALLFAFCDRKRKPPLVSERGFW